MVRGRRGDIHDVMVVVSTTNVNVFMLKGNKELYEEWKENHESECNANYSGSAPSIEAEGSVEKDGVAFLSYYGDSDSKAFEKVENIYPSSTVVKYECIGHNQKKVGNRLRKLRNRTKGLGGKNKSRTSGNGVQKSKSRLTDSIIDKLQNHFGIDLSSKVSNVKEMKNAILARMFHVASSADCNYHTYCPNSNDLWCQYNRDVINGTKLYRAGQGSSVDVIAAIKPIYTNLSDESVLERCMHGLTQNADESFNSTIWERCFKLIYCGLDGIELAVYNAVGN